MSDPAREVELLRREVEQLRSIAYRDAITGLRTRRGLDRHIDGLVSSGMMPLVAFVDLDDFKNINDTWGHGAGDTVLEAIGRRLAACARSTDWACRVGGDEFVLVVEPPMNADELRARIRGCFARPVRTLRGNVAVNGSIGIAQALAGQPAQDVLDRADAAMYLDKRGML